MNLQKFEYVNCLIDSKIKSCHYINLLNSEEWEGFAANDEPHQNYVLELIIICSRESQVEFNERLYQHRQEVGDQSNINFVTVGKTR